MKRLKIKKLNNDGAALILAILIVMFITILTTLLLYVSVMNFEMKTTDYNTKVSFYGAEIPLEELKVQLAADTAKASEEAYAYVLKNFGVLNNEAAREGAFQSIFFDELEQIWTDRMSGAGWVYAMDSVLNPDPLNKKYEVLFNDATPSGSIAYHVILEKPDLVAGTEGTTWERQADDGRIILRSIKVDYVENGYLSMISTDFCIDVPDVDWSVDVNDIPTSGVPADFERNTIDFESYVSYLDWTKQ